MKKNTVINYRVSPFNSYRFMPILIKPHYENLLDFEFILFYRLNHRQNDVSIVNIITIPVMSTTIE